MTVYYIVSRESYENKYNFEGIQKSSKTISSLQNEIMTIPNFCREEISIATVELKSYLCNGITFFTENEENITGLIVFDINVNSIYIIGLCVPEPSVGLGSILINKVKEFAEKNGIINIILTCYDSVKNFYEKLGFKIINENKFYDSDEDSEDEDSTGKIRYEMIYILTPITAGKRKSKKNSKRYKKNKTYKKRKTCKKHNTCKKRKTCKN